MDDRELYGKILGVERPWWVERVELKLAEGQVHVYLEHGEQPWECARCGQLGSLYDHQAERVWRHLDTCQYETRLHAAVPRSNCPEHGALVVKLPWAEAGSHFTELFEALAISWLHAASQPSVAAKLGLSWDEIHSIQDRAVKRGLARREAEPITYLGVDEKAFRKGHRYLTIVNDLARRRVLFVVPDRKQTSLDQFWPTLTEEQRTGIQAVALDMWDPYVASVRANLPEGADKIVFDKFHIAQHLGNAVNKVRQLEHKRLLAAGDDSLKGTKYDWLRNPANFARKRWHDFQQLRTSTLQTARAWALKEMAMSGFHYRYRRVAEKHFQHWYRWATHSRLPAMIAVARTIKKHLPNILTYFKHRITNAASESINSKIQWIKYTARGFRNQQNFINAIYFHCGDLDMSPT